jgi:nucleoside 2-deoxyribosyltransferase
MIQLYPDQLAGAEAIRRAYIEGKNAPLLVQHQILDPRSWSDPTPAIYTARDLQAIRNCDCLLVHMASSNPSGFGLSVELGFAYAIGKRIIFCDEISSDWRSNYFGMHREMANYVCASLADAAAAV